MIARYAVPPEFVALMLTQEAYCTGVRACPFRESTVRLPGHVSVVNRGERRRFSAMQADQRRNTAPASQPDGDKARRNGPYAVEEGKR